MDLLTFPIYHRTHYQGERGTEKVLTVKVEKLKSVMITKRLS